MCLEYGSGLVSRVVSSCIVIFYITLSLNFKRITKKNFYEINCGQQKSVYEDVNVGGT